MGEYEQHAVVLGQVPAMRQSAGASGWRCSDLGGEYIAATVDRNRRILLLTGLTEISASLVTSSRSKTYGQNERDCGYCSHESDSSGLQ